jgi:glycosyltransferase involved in cell wall biosynthesis
MIYVCIPAHDEAKTIGVLLWKVRKVMAGFGRDYHVLVLDDASTDGTAEVVERYRTSLPVTLLKSRERLGYGAAVERLLREAVERAPYPKRDAALVLQGDFTEDPSDLVEMVKTLEGGVDIVAGVPTSDPERRPRRFRWARWLADRVLGPARRNAPVSDPLEGFRIYRVIVLKKAFRDRERPVVRSHERWAANLELLEILAPYARRIEERPVTLRHHLRTRESRFQTLRSLQGLLSLRHVEWITEDEKGRAA